MATEFKSLDGLFFKEEHVRNCQDMLCKDYRTSFLNSYRLDISTYDRFLEEFHKLAERLQHYEAMRVPKTNVQFCDCSAYVWGLWNAMFEVEPELSEQNEELVYWGKSKKYIHTLV